MQGVVSGTAIGLFANAIGPFVNAIGPCAGTTLQSSPFAMSTAVPTEQHPASGPPPAEAGAAGRPHTLPQRLPRRLPRGLAGVGFLLAGAAAWWWLATHHLTNPSPPEAKTAGSRAGAPAEARQPAEAIVVLPAAARAAAGIELATVEPRLLRDQLTVPGRIDYDSRRRLDYASPVDGIVSRVFVQVRQKVSKGDPLAELSSPDVGAARDDVRRREDDRRIEQKAADWASTIADNVEALLDSLAAHPPLADVEKQFERRVLGSYREKILGSYSRLIFVEKVSAGTKSLGEGGVLSGRIVEERASNLEVATANFIAACEEARFLTRQDRDRARATLEQADRLVQISRENLRTLVGSRLESSSEADETESPSETGSLSSLVLRTPLNGIVEDVFVTRGERARVGDRLFVVADTSMLWVRAQIHERQWTAVEVGEGQPVRVVVPGADTHETTAVVNHVGATVEAESRSVPLVAELTNDDAHFKPGMFVWVDLPQGKPRDALAVPAAAVMRHEGQAFVFVPAGEDVPAPAGGEVLAPGGGDGRGPAGAMRFRRVGVTTGIGDGDAVEITGGLAAGDRVVARGAFVLKSELLLEQEAE